MKFEINWVLYLSQVVGLAVALPGRTNDQLPKRTIAGVSVVDTPVVRAAHDLAHQYSSFYLYKHVMRSWLFGALILNHNETLRQSVDLEVHAVAALLHDLGVAEGSPFISDNKRFEVDGAFAARDFIRGRDNETNAAWSDHRVQLVWDAIALHTENAIARYKEPAVAVTSNGILMDFFGAEYGVTIAEYAAVIEEFPHEDFLSGFNQTLLWLAETKPNSTIDTWQQPWGDYLVANYSAVGRRIFDVIAGIHYRLIESR